MLVVPHLIRFAVEDRDAECQGHSKSAKEEKNECALRGLFYPITELSQEHGAFLSLFQVSMHPIGRGWAGFGDVSRLTKQSLTHKEVQGYVFNFPHPYIHNSLAALKIISSSLFEMTRTRDRTSLP